MKLNNMSVRRFVRINDLKKLFSEVKIFTPTKIINGKEKPCVDKGCYWYVVYYYRNPFTDKMEEFRVKENINSFKTVTERKIASKRLQKAVTKMLQHGYNPFEAKKVSETDINKKPTILEAFENAYQEKIKLWSESTINSNIHLINPFYRWLRKEKLNFLTIDELTKRHISLYLNGLTTSGKITTVTRNNHRRLIVSLIQQMVNDDIITHNFANSIPKLKENPKKNKPFTHSQLLEIKKYLLENDPYLYLYIQFIMYAFLRPIEVTRIQLKHIVLEKNIIQIPTKTERSYETIFIIEKLQAIIATMNIDWSNKDYFLFTNKETPYLWSTKTEKSKEDHFIRRFKKVKDALNLDDFYGTYSFRHTFALDLYNNYVNNGLTDLEAKHKLMTITRHKSISSLEKYLRNIGAVLPKDYSDDYTVDF